MLIAGYGFIPDGFPSPASDDLEDVIDLNSRIIKHPSATYYFRVVGEFMTGAHIPPNSLLVVQGFKAQERLNCRGSGRW